MADITTTVAQIRAAVLGIDVRENIALGIEVINTEVVALEATFDALIINAGSSNAEIVAARGSAVDLPTRLGGVDAQLADNSTQLAAKATTAYVDAFTSGSPKGTYATLAALQTAFPTGTTGVYIVTADGKLYSYIASAWTAGGIYQATGIAPGSIINNMLDLDAIGTSKIQHMVESVNLLNDRKIISGYYVDSAGVLQTTSVYSVTDYIYVDPSTQYKVSWAVDTSKCAVYYDKNKAFLGYTVVVGGGLDYAITTHANAKFMRVNILDTKKIGFMIVKGTTMPGAFVPYSLIVDGLSVITSYSSLDADLQGRINVVGPERVQGFLPSANLLNPNTITPGYVVTSSAGPTVNATFGLSDFIKVVPSTAYAVSRTYSVFVAFYTDSKTFITTMNVGNIIGYTFSTPVNAEYMRINILNSYATNFMVVAGAVIPVTFVPYGAAIDWLLYKDGSVDYDSLDTFLKNAIDTGASSKWEGKSIVTFGDSITWYDGQLYNAGQLEEGILVRGYQTFMREQLGATVINQGVSGNTMPQICTRILAYNFAGVDAVTITAGANDFRNTVEEALGTIQAVGTAFDDTTYIGAFQKAIEYILGVNPEIKIYLLMPVKGWSGATLMPTTYPDAVKAIGLFYSLSVCEWYYNSGINDLTKLTFIGDIPASGYYLHPSTKGFARMGNIIVPFLENN